MTPAKLYVSARAKSIEVARAGTDSWIRRRQSGSVQAKGSYSPGWEVSNGRLIHVAGQIPWDSEGRTVAKGHVAGQTRRVFENIGAVLAEAGATLDHVIKIKIFAADIRYRDEIKRVRGETFSPPYPASTQVAVAALVDPEWLVEIEAVAFVPD